MRSPFAVLALMLASALHAQDSTEAVADGYDGPDTARAAAGDAIRITAPSLGVHEVSGMLISIRDDSVRFRVPGPNSQVIAIPYSDVTSFDVNHGNKPAHRRVQEGAALGAGILGAAGYLYDIGSPKSQCQDSNGCSATLVGVLTGGLIGAFVGLFFKTEPYEQVDLPTPAKLSVAPTWDPAQRAPGVMLAVRF
jgi:hypothetical protein